MVNSSATLAEHSLVAKRLSRLRQHRNRISKLITGKGAVYSARSIIVASKLSAYSASTFYTCFITSRLLSKGPCGALFSLAVRIACCLVLSVATVRCADQDCQRQSLWTASA